MPRPEMTPYSKQLFLELADDEWHSIDDIYMTLAPLVPPERRVSELEKLRRQTVTGQANYSWSKLAIRVAQQTVSSFVRNGSIEREDQRIRVTSMGKVRVLKALGYEVEPPMRAKHSPAMKKLYELLADGEWRDREEVIQQIMPLVPPEKAFRATIKSRESQAARRGYTPDMTKGDPHRTGQRSIARTMITGQIKSGGVVAEGDKLRAALPGMNGYKLK